MSATMSEPDTAGQTDTARRLAWRHGLGALALLVAAILLLYFGTFKAMVLIWDRSDTFAHCFLVPPISLWMIWRLRAELALLTPRPAPWLLLGMAASAGVWLVGELVAVNAATQWFATTLLILSVPAVLGWRVARRVTFPLLYLYFAVPVGEFLMPQLMQSTADFTVTALRLSGIPVYREGLQFVIPSGNWSVVEACSGVRYLMASFMVGTLFAYLNYSSTRRRVIFGIVSLAVPIVANWLRAYMIVMLGHLSGNTLAVGADHLVYGWVFFGVIITIVFMIGARWSEPPAAPASVPGPGSAGEARPPRPGSAWATAVAAVLVLVAPLLVLQQLGRSVVAAEPRLALPAALGAWRKAEAQAWKPGFQNPSTEEVRIYQDEQGRRVGLYLGYYRAQHAGRKLISSENVIVTSQDPLWNAVESAPLTLPVAPGVVRQTQLRPAPSSGVAQAGRLVWQVYWVDGRWLHRDSEAKLAGAWQRLRGHGDDSAVLVLHADGEAQAASAVLETFVRENLAMIEAGLKAAQRGQ